MHAAVHADPHCRRTCRLHPRTAAGPPGFLLVCDHASRLIPHSLGSLGLDETQLASHVAWDIGAAGVAQRLSSALDATLLLQSYSRLVIDCNRPPGSASSIPTRSEYVRIAANEGLATADQAARVAEIFVPYHAAISTVLDQRRVAGIRTVLVSIHSFTPVYLGQTRPWQIGLMYRDDRRLGRALLELLRQDNSLHPGRTSPTPSTMTRTTQYPCMLKRDGSPMWASKFDKTSLQTFTANKSGRPGSRNCFHRQAKEFNDSHPRRL